MSGLLFPCDDAATAALTAATRRRLERAVIGVNLCPFARAVHVKQQVRDAVTGATAAAVEFDWAALEPLRVHWRGARAPGAADPTSA